MHSNFNMSDFNCVKKILKKDAILTQFKNVSRFESHWSKWLGVKYSVFVNSGASANYLTMLILKILYGPGGEIIVPTLTWNSDINSVIGNGFKPIFSDIDLSNLCISEDEIINKINKKTKAVFITHAQGFNGLSKNILNILKKKKIILIEDVCESHGAKFGDKKLGTFGLISNFSFYYAHHMSTIEGGMICTNDRKIYEIARMLRAHGMARESGNKNFEKRMINKHHLLSPKFIFLYPGFNMRSNEISAVIGINQLKRLDKNNSFRKKNISIFLENLDSSIYFVNFNLEGNSNYAFPLILQKPSFKMRDKLENIMISNGIEFRRGNAGGGNQLRQPYLASFLKKNDLKKFPNVEHVHFFGYYIGNYPTLKKEKILKICSILNKI